MMSANNDEGEKEFYPFSMDKGLCLVGEVVVNLAEISVMQKQGDKTLIYRPGVVDPIVLPADVFAAIREIVFDDDDFDGFDDEDDEDDD